MALVPTTLPLITSFILKAAPHIIKLLMRERCPWNNRSLHDLSPISNYIKEVMVVFNAFKTRFLHLSTYHNFLQNYIFKNRKLISNYVFKILTISFPMVYFLKGFIISLFGVLSYLYV